MNQGSMNQGSEALRERACQVFAPPPAKNTTTPGQGEYIREILPGCLFISDRINKIHMIFFNHHFMMSPKDSFNPVNLVNPVKKLE